jgi:hypothetical protein
MQLPAGFAFYSWGHFGIGPPHQCYDKTEGCDENKGYLLPSLDYWSNFGMVCAGECGIVSRGFGPQCC